MRILNYILILCVSLLSFSCEKKVVLPEEDGQIIVVPEGEPYIYIDAMVGKKTRGTLIEGNELQYGFGVYGFTYDFNNRWTTYRATATPNVFKNTTETAFEAPQEVTYNNGIYSYSPIQKWSGGKYTFFAYYPYNNLSVNPSGMTVQGTPYIDYAPANFLTSTANHTDVLTAMFQDTSLSSSQYVDFDFQHRLSAIETVALNFYEYNHSEGGNVSSEKIKIEITGLNLTFDNLDYMKARFYLDSSIPSDYTPINGTATYNLTPGDNASTLDYSTTSEFHRINPQQTLLFIPQTDEDLKVTTTVSYRKKRPNGTYLNVAPDTDSNTTVNNTDQNKWIYTTSKVTEFGQSLKAGSRYYIQMTFTSAAVSINILTSAEWEDLADDVYHEFE